MLTVRHQCHLGDGSIVLEVRHIVPRVIRYYWLQSGQEWPEEGDEARLELTIQRIALDGPERPGKHYDYPERVARWVAKLSRYRAYRPLRYPLTPGETIQSYLLRLEEEHHVLT